MADDDEATIMNDELLGNLTTLIKMILITFLPAEVMAQYDPSLLAAAMAMVIGFLFSIMDAKYPNTFKWLKKAPDKAQEPIMEQILNDEYV